MATAGPLSTKSTIDAFRIFVALTIGLAWIALGIAFVYSAATGAFARQNDFSVFWSAGHLALEDRAHLYDPEALQRALSALGMQPRPVLAHPPTALLLFIPTAFLPFWASYAVWISLSLAMFIVAARKIESVPAIMLALLSPPVLQCLLMGQMSLFLAAAAILGVSLLERRPMLGGFVIGLAAAMKPQLFLVAPILLWPNRQALIGLVLGGVFAFSLSLLLGPYLWRDWLSAITHFQTDITSSGVITRGVSPTSLAQLLDVPVLPMQLLGIAAGVSLAWWVRAGAAEEKLFGLIAGSILCSPYALFYDLSAIAPVIAAAFLTATWRGMGQVVGLFPIWPAYYLPVTVASFAASRHADKSDRGRSVKTRARYDAQGRKEIPDFPPDAD